ncbi:transposase [Roseivivax sediminis]|uniref:transposase n=1 Tax=Roseivivax sediminis TaxID=936889 RepID=UPI00122C86C6
MLVSRLDPTFEPTATRVRRLKVITGVGGRRYLSDADKRRIIEEALAPGAVVSEIAPQYGLRPQQLFTWRREARRRLAVGQSAERAAPLFVPAVCRGGVGC